MADTAYDADYLRQAAAAKGATAVIPNTPSRALKYPLDKHLYAQRYLVECSQQAQAVPARRNTLRKDARNYLAVTLAAIVFMTTISFHTAYRNCVTSRSRMKSIKRS
jgi:hypothetical protein